MRHAFGSKQRPIFSLYETCLAVHTRPIDENHRRKAPQPGPTDVEIPHTNLHIFLCLGGIWQIEPCFEDNVLFEFWCGCTSYI